MNNRQAFASGLMVGYILGCGAVFAIAMAAKYLL